MVFFNRNNKNTQESSNRYDESAKYKVLGTGCAKCTNLLNNLNALKNDGIIEGSISKVSDPLIIANYGVMSTPALVVDEKLIFKGQSPSKDKLKQILNSI